MVINMTTKISPYNSFSYLSKLLNENQDLLLTNIFEFAISTPKDAAILARVSKKCKAISDSDWIWEKLSTSKHFDKKLEDTWKESYEMHQIIFDAINKAKNIKRKRRIAPKTKSISFYNMDVARAEFVRIYLGLNQKEEAKKHIDKMDYCKFDAQMELIKAYPDQNEINEAKKLVDKECRSASLISF